ncbi:MAG: 50S ribosomal protein L9 [Deltaproteobacteria bacterium]|jgi:large subunit ribosomal protein L9
MKIILTKDVDALGMTGQIFDVAKGYARNYLIPHGYALEATDQNLKRMEGERQKVEDRMLKAKDEAERARDKIAEVLVTIAQKAGEDDKLYGSVTTMDIAAHLEKQGISIDRRKIHLDKPIKTLGEFEVPVKLHPEVTAAVKVVVVPEEEG